MLKRLSAFLLALLLALGLTACADQYGVTFVTTGPAAPVEEAVPADPEETVPVDPKETVSAGPEETAPEETAPVESEEPASQVPEVPEDTPAAPAVSEDGWYSSKEEVALYIHLYGRLPDNYVTKKEAQALGWTGGSVEPYAGEGTAIGGSRFGNYEGLLPEAKGRTYTECDIDTVGGSSRGAKRVVFSNDGLVYYTGDHYNSFELLYGEP